MTLPIPFTDKDRADLRAMWMDPKVSYRKIQARFDLHPDTLRRMARDVGLGDRPYEALWTDERVEILRQGIAAGLSFSQVALQVGRGCSREAAIGKAHRMGFAQPGAASSPKPGPRAPSVKRAPGQNNGLAFKTRKFGVAGNGAVFIEPEARAPRAVVQDRNDAPGTATLLTLGPHMCKWPIGDPRADDFTFCGSPKGDGPYCSKHLARAYASPALKTYVDNKIRPTAAQAAA